MSDCIGRGCLRERTRSEFAALRADRDRLAAELAEARADAERWRNLCKRVIASRDSGVVVGGPESVYSVEKDIRAALSARTTLDELHQMDHEDSAGVVACPDCGRAGDWNNCGNMPCVMRAGLTVGDEHGR